ncbi:tellurite resistance/C4-dicarboxylate transporter family protein [Rhodococcus marinonascens]|uniref:tellurite resistance/C4-dicarboxylate transporter family protein n=1 Tax=Rhodococcus marinonascens TaxID=38311 RepID=UPI00093253D9|nr:tellurite resistance/C4-dicarboxylate transporter family protein [Rhodococcus marinonascens]
MSREHRAKSSTGRTLEVIPPGAGAAAMSTGIVSVALHLAGFELLSRLWFVIGVLIWSVLVLVFVARLADDRARWVDEADTPPALTGVAATSVLGARCVLIGWESVGVAALVIAAIAWIVLMPAVVRHWTAPTVGAHFLLCVATQGLAVLGSTLAAAKSAQWLAATALGMFVLGLGFYLIVLARFSFNQLRVGAGDQWVFAGALAISALAAGELAMAAEVLGWPVSLHRSLQIAGVVIIGSVLACYAVLVACEVRWPRLHYDVRRWSTTFPMGMTSAASLTVAAAASTAWLEPVGSVLVWPAALLCLILLVATVWHLRIEAKT